MDGRVFLTAKEYLHTQFDGSDREYLDGEVVERNRGELPHARLQAEIVYRLRSLAKALGLQVLPEIRIQMSPTRFRVADVAVRRSGAIGERIPTFRRFSSSRSCRRTTVSSGCSRRFESTWPTASSACG
jgi:hypothetical protein